MAESPEELRFHSRVRDTMFTRMDGPHAVRNEVLACQRETGNTRDQFAEGYEMWEYNWTLTKKFSLMCSQVFF